MRYTPEFRVRGIEPAPIRGHHGYRSADRLAYMSNRAMGALEFKPARGPGTQRAITIELSELFMAARKSRAR